VTQPLAAAENVWWFDPPNKSMTLAHVSLFQAENVKMFGGLFGLRPKKTHLVAECHTPDSA